MTTEPKHSEVHRGKMARKAARRDKMHQELNAPRRVRGVLDNSVWRFGRPTPRTRYMPHQGKREIARRLAKAES